MPSAGRDLVAGLTVAALALPSAMAYAELAGLSPVNGLYALLLPTVAYVLLGSSRPLVIGPEGTTATVVAAAVLPLAAAGSDDAAELASMLALLVGACFLLARLLRLGWIADYFSRPVLIGYLHGIAITLVIAQLGKLLGLDIDADGSLGRLAEVVRELGDVSGATVAVSAASLAALLGLRRYLPFVPGALIVVVTRSRPRGRSISQATGSRPSVPSRPACPARPCRRRRSPTCSSSRPRRSASSSSPSPTRSSPLARSPGSGARTCAPRRSS